MTIAAGLLSTLLVWSAGTRLGIPHTPAVSALFHDIPPGGLHRFLGLGLPAAAALPSLALSLLLWLNLAAPGEASRRAWRWDLAGSLALLLLPIIELAWRHLPHSFVLAGALLLGVVTVKGVGLMLCLRGLFPTVPDGSTLGFRRGVAALLVAFCLLAPLSIWVWKSFSAAGDEVRYLLITHSLVRHGTTDVSQTVANREYRAFYTGAWHPKMAWEPKRAGIYIFHLVLAPAYLFGGRLGVMLFMAALAALAAVGTLSWLWRGGLSPPAAGMAVLLVFVSVPVLNLGQHALPDVPGILLFVAGLLALQSLERAPFKAWVALLAIAVGLLLLKNRLSFLGGGLLLAGAMEQWLWFRRTSRRAAWLWAGAAALLGLALIFVLLHYHVLLWDVGKWWGIYLAHWAAAGVWWRPIAVFLGGMGLDQQQGILLPAPIYLLALAGLPAACRRLPAISRQALISSLFYLGVITFLRWDFFFGGDGPAGRFITMILPAAALFIAFAWQHLQRRAWRIIPLLLAAATIAGGLALTLVPSAQFHKTTGVHKLLGLVDRWWGCDVHHLFPSSFSAVAWWTPWLVGGGILLAVLVWRVWRDSCRPAAAPSPWRPWEWGMAGLVVVVGLATLLGLARAYPPASLEAEQMASSRASLYGVVAGGAKPIGRSLAPGGRVWGRLYYPGGNRRLVVKGFCGAPGRLSLTVDGQPRGQVTCPPDGKMTFVLSRRKAGYVRLELAWSSCPQKRCYLFIDRLDLLPAPGDN